MPVTRAVASVTKTSVGGSLLSHAVTAFIAFQVAAAVLKGMLPHDLANLRTPVALALALAVWILAGVVLPKIWRRISVTTATISIHAQTLRRAQGGTVGGVAWSDLAKVRWVDTRHGYAVLALVDKDGDELVFGLPNALRENLQELLNTVGVAVDRQAISA